MIVDVGAPPVLDGDRAAVAMTFLPAGRLSRPVVSPGGDGFDRPPAWWGHSAACRAIRQDLSWVSARLSGAWKPGAGPESGVLGVISARRGPGQGTIALVTSESCLEYPETGGELRRGARPRAGYSGSSKARWPPGCPCAMPPRSPSRWRRMIWPYPDIRPYGSALTAADRQRHGTTAPKLLVTTVMTTVITPSTRSFSTP